MWAVCGEALFDLFAIAQTATGVTLDARTGSSAFNMTALLQEGVDTGMVQRHEAPSTLSLMRLGPAPLPG